MADKKFIIEVRTKGFAKANRDMGKLDTSSKSYDKTAGRMRGTTNGLQGSIGALRNRILVYTFAIGGAVAAMNKFVKAASGFEDVKTRLVGLTGSVEKAESAFQAFNQVAATTPFQLDDVVNAGAQLEAFGVDAEATLMATTDLAAFMGTTAVEAASSLGRAFAGGAGAADILRERGILQLIKDSQGIDDLTKLTLPEFRVALIQAMADPDGRISGSSARMSETFSGSVSNMKDAVTRFNAKVGAEMIPTLKIMVNATEDFFRSLEISDVKRYAIEAVALGGTVLYARTAMALAAGATWKFNAALGMTVKLLRGLGIGLAIAALDHWIQLVQSGQVYMDGWKIKVKSWRLEEQKLGDTLNTNKDKLNKYIERLDEEAEVTAEVTDAVMKQIKAKHERIEELIIERRTMETTDRVLKAVIESRIKGIEISEYEIELLQDIEDAKKRIAAEEKKRATDKSVLALQTRFEAEQAAESQRIIEQNLQDQMRAATQAIEDRITAMRGLRDEMEGVSASNLSFMISQISGQKELGQLEDLRVKTVNKMVAALDVLTDGQGAVFQSTLESATIQELLTKDMGEFLLVTDDVNNILKDYQLSAGESAAQIVKFNEKQKEATNSSNQMARSILAVAGAMKAMTAEGATSEQQLSTLMQTIGSILMMIPGGQGWVPGAMMTAGSMFIGHTGGLVKDNGIQRFAQGGMVQGRDNVPIMAQAGEFIMRRDAVQNIGVQNLAQMNKTGQGGVTVNIQGNMIGNDEFVRDNLLPQIAKAARQNLA
jgi:hypothetical protein